MNWRSKLQNKNEQKNEKKDCCDETQKATVWDKISGDNKQPRIKKKSGLEFDSN